MPRVPPGFRHRALARRCPRYCVFRPFHFFLDLFFLWLGVSFRQVPSPILPLSHSGVDQGPPSTASCSNPDTSALAHVASIGAYKASDLHRLRPRALGSNPHGQRDSVLHERPRRRGATAPSRLPTPPVLPGNPSRVARGSAGARGGSSGGMNEREAVAGVMDPRARGHAASRHRAYEVSGRDAAGSRRTVTRGGNPDVSGGERRRPPPRMTGERRHLRAPSSAVASRGARGGGEEGTVSRVPGEGEPFDGGAPVEGLKTAAGEASADSARRRVCPPLNCRASGAPFGASKANSWHAQQVVQEATTPVQVRASLRKPSARRGCGSLRWEGWGRSARYLAQRSADLQGWKHKRRT